MRPQAREPVQARCWILAVLVTAACAGRGGVARGTAFAGSANPADGCAVQFRGDLTPWSYVYVADAQLFDKSDQAVTVVSLEVSIKAKGLVDEGHLAFTPKGSSSFYATWTPGDPGENQPSRIGDQVPLSGVVVPPHAYFQSERTSTFAKLRLAEAGTYEADDLVVTYSQGGRQYRQLIASGYQLWTRGSVPPPIGRSAQPGIEHTTAPVSGH